MVKNWRLILDDDGDGCFNMAADEAILFCYPECKTPTLRIYGWSSPWVTLGFSQNSRRVINPGCRVPFVRRITGGSAIYHYLEITYSLVFSANDLDMTASVKESYAKLALFLLNFYARLGIKGEFAYSCVPEKVRPAGNFCFSSCEHFDIIIDNKKIGGNAQRRRRAMIFQQGSIPFRLDRPSIAMAITDCGYLSDTADLEELTKVNRGAGELKKILAQSFSETFDVDLRLSGYNPNEISCFRALITEKYNTTDWNCEGKIHEKAAVAG